MTGLTKWPRLLVTGQPITPEQADEVLIRTANPWLLQVNDRDWNATVARVFNLDVADYGHATMESTRAAVERYGLLELSLIYTSRISSSWIGGPHGWCDWDGRIGSSNYNIGKWPEADHVTAEWELIARTFPYLDLTAQLVTNEGAGQVAAEWRVKNGTAEPCTPGAQITELTELSEADVIGRLFLGGERGVPEDRLRDAAARVLASRTH
ncbi:hypothetical protein QEH48_gp082 [Streptomyces phage TurkishDelight]|uniref:Uncharacterized protein n=1 Tax=Streptomyces phage TurkishDelight TaxID=2793708 RepID=A0A7T0M166_9CAUD|nr:hypothetical protein QEH48_gp082 [Streptomyces phage TurkishDelight]QPL14111.1 hypothetical protein SEA_TURKISHDELIGHT_82 [Streptomyces phage TurkishDelight]